MAQYYGVTRTNEYLMHYGIKGMRWGVQRAKESGNEKRLARHYAKAKAHLKKLQDRTDIKKQKKEYEENRAMAIADAVAAPLSVGTGFLATHISKNNATARLAKNVAALKNVPGIHWVSDSYRDYRPWGIASGAAYTGAAIGRGVLANRAKKRMTKEGHRQAVMDVADWQREMNRAFAGTKYGKSKKRRR